MIKLVKSKKIYVGKSWSLRLDKFRFNDRIIEKEIVEHLPSVGMIPILDNDNILLVSQYRIAARKNLLEIPAGKIEQGETPRQAALRDGRGDRLCRKTSSAAKDLSGTRL